MKVSQYLYVSLCSVMIASCAGTANDNDTVATDSVSALTEIEDNESIVAPCAASLPTTSPKVETTITDADLTYTPLPEPVYTEKSGIPKKITSGMKVYDAMQIPGVKQSVSAIMTGGKITGTVVLQYKGKSYYTNVDFAEEGCYAFGTRCQTPEQVEAFIELACSESLTPDDFAPEAIVTEQAN